MCKDGNDGVKVREFAVVVPLTLLSPGRVEEEINKFSQTLTPKIPTLFMCDALHYTSFSPYLLGKLEL